MDCSLIAFDLDGTMLDDMKNVPAENIEALCAAADKGITIVPASGRLYPYIPEPIRTLPFIRYCIINNGGGVYDAKEDRMLYSAEIPLEAALRIIDYFDSIGVIYDCYTGNRGYMQDEMLTELKDYCTGPVMENMYRTYIVKIRDRVDNLRSFLVSRGSSVQKMQSYYKDQDFRRAQLKELKELFPDIVPTTSLDVNIELNSTAATKGQALAALCRELGINPAQAAAFGDGLNDLDMIETSGISVAMSNGCEEIKSAARYISVCSNNTGGVGRTLSALGII